MTSGTTSGTKRPCPADFDKEFLPPQWISTWNNYTEDDIIRFRAWCEKRTTFSVVGREVGALGTPHLQGFHQVPKTKFRPFHKTFPKVWVTPVVEDNGCEDYCSKDGQIVIKSGEYHKKQQGQRTDRDAIARMAQEGATFAEIATAAPAAVILWSNGISKLCSHFAKPRDRNLPKFCICLYGKTGTHKTKRVYDHCERLGVPLFPWSSALKGFFQGYKGEKHVLMDEYRGQLPMEELLQLTDRYPMRVNIKNGDAEFVADYLYFTSPMHPKSWYTNTLHDSTDQVERRFNEGGGIIEVLSPDQDIDLTLPHRPSV